METITEQNVELVQQPVEPVIEPVVEPVVEPIVEHAVEPVIETAIEPNVEPVIEKPPENIVIQNSDHLYKSEIKWDTNIEYVEPNEFEINLLHGTKNPKQLIEEEGKEEIVLKTEEEIKKQKTKDLLLIFKVVSLNRLGHHPIKNTSTLQPTQVKDFLAMMNSLIDDYNKGLEVPITEEFNKICLEKLFANNTDLSNYPVYN